jgi:vacuolar-type H+-ATPase subunit I/STV1
MLKTIEATSKFTIIEDDIKQLKLQVAAIKERQLEGLDANIRLQEKAADAYVLSKEASAISKATQRELAATSENLKSEVKTMIQSVEDKLDVIKRATTNPLDRR